MKKTFIIICIVLFWTSPNCLAGFSSYKDSYSTDMAVAPVYIPDQGLFNFVIKIQFLLEPYDKKPYTTDSYSQFISRISLEWSDIATHTILSSNISKVSDIKQLKNDIKAEINKRAEILKSMYTLKKQTELIYSITGCYLVKPD